MTIELATERLRLWLDPERGVEWRALHARRGDDWLALVPDCRDDAPSPRAGQSEAAPLPAASFHMLPYSNRIRDGRFEYDGVTHQLGRPDKHAIHGALRRLPWSVQTVTATRALCTFDSRTVTGVDWPWPIEASIDHVLVDGRLSSELSLTNRGDTPMPAGFGWHPYFVREVEPGAHPTLTLPVDAVYPDADGDALPDGAPVPLPAELDFRSPRALDPEQRIDCCLAGLAGRCKVRWPDAGVGFSLQASPVCGHLVLFNPDMPHFAVEPVSNANDAVNLEARGIDAGLQRLAPGETLRATMTLILDDA